ncbi:MAG: type I methionyl aminopeptidase [Patescibacteria group bacterium]
MNYQKNEAEIEIMRIGGRILAQVVAEIVKEVKPGVSTSHLDMLARQSLKAHNASPSFLGYRTGKFSFPASLCTSVDNAVVHGIPSPDFILQEGQIIGLDLGAWYKGLCTDMAVTVSVGKISKSAGKLIKITREALTQAIVQVHAGARVGDIGEAIQSLAEAAGFNVVRALVGHGVGRAVHEEPRIPNFGQRGTGFLLQDGMTIAIEPMINAGKSEVKVLPDNWTVVTVDNSLSAHFEHTVLVTKHGAEILTIID